MQNNINLCVHCMTKVDPGGGNFCPNCGKKHSVHYSQSYELPAGICLCNGRYFVGKSIGRGGFGISYIGFDIKLERKILIKETFHNGEFERNVNDIDNPEPLKVTYSDDFSLDEIMRKTRKECVSLTEAEGLNNIVKVYDWFSENNTAYIITEFIDGITLDKRVRQKGYYSWNELYKKLKPLMQSLSVLHEKGIIHRDIKPQNIMIKNINGVREEFILIDFGLARSTEVRTLSSLSISFTPGYSPFEQRSFSKKDNTYTDIYALAATIYFALTSSHPNIDIHDTIMENFPKIDILSSEYGVPSNVVNTLIYALNPNYELRCNNMEVLMKMFTVAGKPPHYLRGQSRNNTSNNVQIKSRNLNVKIDDNIQNNIYMDSKEKTKQQIKSEYYRRKKEKERQEKQQQQEIESTINELYPKYANKPFSYESERPSIKVLIVPVVFVILLYIISFLSRLF